MDDSSPAASIILYLVFLLIDVFFYGFSEALDSLNENELERKAEEEKDKKSIRLMEIISKPAKYDNTFEMITTLINVIIGAMHLGLLLTMIRNGLTYLAENQFKLEVIPAEVILVLASMLSTLLLLYITLTLGVLLPKKIAQRMPEKWAYACITPVFLVTQMLLPFTGLVSVSVKGILRIFGMKEDSGENDVTEEEIINMVNEGHEQGLIQASEAEMISNIFEFGDKEVQDIMTHRNNIVAIDSNTLLQDAITYMIEGKKSRYPVYDENIDHILGILHFKDAVMYQRTSDGQNPALKEIDGLMREARFVPQTKHIDELFREMQAEKLQMVVVVDEYGQTDGLVAMEDILEEIVGNILDEYDDESEYIEEKSEDEYIIEGITPLEELEDRFEISFEDEEFETLNGFLISRLDRIPEPDERFDVDYQGYNFKILTVENKMIQSVLVKKLPDRCDDKAEETAEKCESKED